MATKQVRETAAGQSISAYIVLNKAGKHVATVNAHFANSGGVTVNVWTIGDAAALRSANTAAKTNNRAAVKACRVFDHDTEQQPYLYFQADTASGGGYDKFTAALSGMIIDGHTIPNHGGHVPEVDKKRAKLMHEYCMAANDDDTRKAFEARAAKIGCRFVNWDNDTGKWKSLHYESGLNYLEALEYTVIQAI